MKQFYSIFVSPIVSLLPRDILYLKMKAIMFLFLTETYVQTTKDDPNFWMRVYV